MALAGITDIDFALSKVTGRMAHAHALLRRLAQSRGGLIACPTYGYDLHNAIGTSTNFAIQQRVREQMYADERTQAAAVDVTFVSGVLTVKIEIVGSSGPFELTISGSSDLTAEILIANNRTFWAL